MVNCSSYDFDVLKKTIWLEARGEPHEGKVQISNDKSEQFSLTVQRNERERDWKIVAVAYVIINRARANRSYFGGNTIAGVCLHPHQFAPWNNRRPEGTHCQGDGWECMDGWVRDVIEGIVRDPMGGALYFNNPDKEGYPEWTRNVKREVKIANHQFYNE